MDDDFIIENKGRIALRRDGAVKFASASIEVSGKRVFSEVWYEAPKQDVYTADNALDAIKEAVDKLKLKVGS